MNVDRLILVNAELFILLSLVLIQIHSMLWLWFTPFIGANMFQAAFTGLCPMAMILKKQGKAPDCAFQ
jgi:Inner membrane protein YgaP-like, transmembrane domain